MNNQLNLMHIWQLGDWVSRSVIALLLLMSIASWLVIVIKIINLWVLRKQASVAEGFWHCHDFEEAVSCLGNKNTSPWRILSVQGQEALRHHQNSKKQLHDELSLSDWITRILRDTLDTISSRQSAGLAILASVGSTAPFIGLFGTVWGIYHALISLSSSGINTIDKVAAPIGEALIMTAFGLAVAIPAVLGYNALNRANRAFFSKLRHFAHDLHAFLITGSRVPSALEIIGSAHRGE